MHHDMWCYEGHHPLRIESRLAMLDRALDHLAHVCIYVSYMMLLVTQRRSRAYLHPSEGGKMALSLALCFCVGMELVVYGI